MRRLFTIAAVGLGWQLAVSDSTATIPRNDCSSISLGCFSSSQFEDCADATAALMSVCSALRPTCAVESSACEVTTSEPCSESVPFSVTCNYDDPTFPGGDH